MPVVTASVFGGPGDPSTGHTGYRGDNLSARWNSFAELSNNYGSGLSGLDFGALGNLPYGTAVRVTNPKNGRSLVLYKRDVGAGGPGLGGRKRGIDLWYKAAEYLGVSGLQNVEVQVLGKGAAAKNAGIIPGVPGGPDIPGLPDIPGPDDLLDEGIDALGLEGIVAPFKTIANILQGAYTALFSIDFWLRALEVIIGLYLMVQGMKNLGGSLPDAPAPARAAKSQVKSGVTTMATDAAVMAATKKPKLG